MQLDTFRAYYNRRRPHRALERQTPLAVFNARLKARPAPRTPPVDHRGRRDKVDRFGKLILRYLGRLRHIPVGAAHKNRRVRLLIAGADVRIVTEGGQLLRALTPDPTRSYQPPGGCWPVYDVSHTSRSTIVMSQDVVDTCSAWSDRVLGGRVVIVISARELRRQTAIRGWDQRALARHGGVSEATVSRAMAGHGVRGITALKLVQALRRHRPPPELEQLVMAADITAPMALLPKAS